MRQIETHGKPTPRGSENASRPQRPSERAVSRAPQLADAKNRSASTANVALLATSCTDPGGHGSTPADHPGTDVSALSIHPGTDEPPAGTREGVNDKHPAQKTGPSIDPTGSTMVDTHFYASGRPGPGLQNLAGLIHSTDSGRTWTAVPDAPQLLVTAFADAGTAVGVSPDGQVFISGDGEQSWQISGQVPSRPHAITAESADADGVRIWIATNDGIHPSTDIHAATDAGRTFTVGNN